MNSFRLRSLLLLPVVLFSFMLFLNGCEQKKDANEQPAQTVDTTKQTPAETPKVEPVTDVKGKYTGTFDKKFATLNITSQTENTFKGNLVVNYRNPLHQDIEGEFDVKTMEFSMKDINPGRFQGTYKGKFSDDYSSLSGTFSLNSKGGSYSFNLKKK